MRCQAKQYVWGPFPSRRSHPSQWTKSTLVFVVEDLMTGAHYDWRIGANYVRLEPWGEQAHILKVL